MLYAGVLKGENVALHSIWGIRTKDDKRLLVGKSALTTLDVGKESSEVDEKDLILSRLSAISFLSLSENELLRINEALEKYHWSYVCKDKQDKRYKAKAEKHGYGIYGSSYAFKLLKVAKIHKNAFHKTKQKQG